ncbi:MAG: cytochrome bc1 complex cytochrome b subunit [Thermoleophilaceae bacterium]
MTDPVDEPVRFLDERLGAAQPLRKAMRYLFPDHWSFLLGEIALYSFVVLVATGTFLGLFFDPSDATTTWNGPYAPLDGTPMTRAYASALDLSFKVPSGLLMRQTHHWAALVFLVAILLHLLRIFYTAAFRKPRELNYMVGLTLLGVAILEGFMGYSLLDDLLSGAGLAIGYGTALSIPLAGGPLATLIWDGQFPGGDAFFPRLFFAHVFLIPAMIAALISVHLAMIVRQRHSQFPGPGRRQANVVGSPMWPSYMMRSLGLFAATAAVLLLAGGLIQINPVWQWGPFEPYLGENGAQPDWYLGWLIGALRLMPNIELHAFGRTLVPNPFFGGLLFPTFVFAVLYAWPWIERRFLSRDYRRHDLLDRPRDNPRRTAFATAFLVWVATVFVAGSADRLFLAFGVSYEAQVQVFRVLFFLAPVVAYWATERICSDLARRGHPLRGRSGTVIRRNAEGGFDAVEHPSRTPAQSDRR